MTAYMYFATEFEEWHKKDDSGFIITDFFRLTSETWAEMTDAER